MARMKKGIRFGESFWWITLLRNRLAIFEYNYVDWVAEMNTESLLTTKQPDSSRLL
jgi:hypothetical protein